MIYKIQGQKAVAWAGERINGVAYPRDIERKWSDEELAEIGLYRVQPADPPPDGFVAVNTEVQVVNGVPNFVEETLPDSDAFEAQLFASFPEVPLDAYAALVAETTTFLTHERVYDDNYRLVAIYPRVPTKPSASGGTGMLQELGAFIEKARSYGIATIGYDVSVGYATSSYLKPRHNIESFDGHKGRLLYTPVDTLPAQAPLAPAARLEAATGLTVAQIRAVLGVT